MQIQAINNLNSMANIQKVSNNYSNMNFGCAIAKDCFCPSCAKEAQAKQYVKFIEVPTIELPEAQYAKTLENNYHSCCDKDCSEKQYVAVTKFIA